MENPYEKSIFLQLSSAEVDPDTVWSPLRLRPMLQDLAWGVPCFGPCFGLQSRHSHGMKN